MAVSISQFAIHVPYSPPFAACLLRGFFLGILIGHHFVEADLMERRADLIHAGFKAQRSSGDGYRWLYLLS